uniref:FAD-binding FR-type domain-containing protein n=1 Tax=Tetradesmus obliquus TaxID=3088 RepID=A0A383VD77_TETOB|eukprot:jgi/Sobl393_1/2839/SZX73922.1
MLRSSQLQHGHASKHLAYPHAVGRQACAGLRHVPARPEVAVRSSVDPDELHEAKLGPNVVAGIREVKEKLTWSPATVIRNEAINLDGTHRLLHLSVSDEVDMLYGRKIQAVPDTARWIESFTVPGQFVGVRPTTQDETNGLADNQHLYTIACSPYESRRDSAYIGGSIIEVVIDKRNGGDQSTLADMAPGATVEVSQVVGRGFASLFNSYSGLPSSLEEQRNILAIAVGLRGIAAIRAVLNWAPVQAHATSHRVSCVYVTKSPSSAAFLAEWDQWREAGINFHPLYTESMLKSSSEDGEAPAANGSSSSSGSDAVVTAADIMGLLDQGLFLHEHGIESVLGGRASDATVLLAGLGGDIASAVAKELTFKGVAWERLLFCDYF